MDLGASIRDLGSGVFRFLYAWVLPSAVIVAVYLLVVAPPEFSENLLVETDGDGALGRVLVAGIITATFSMAVGLLSLPVYRFVEGYTMPACIARPLRRRHLVRRKRLLCQVQARRGPHIRSELLLEKLQAYPESKGSVMPTRLGNSLRSMEEYGHVHFGLDSQLFWYDLMAVAPQPLRSDIEEARAPVDFFFSAALHLTCLAVASFMTSAAVHSVRGLIVGSIALLLVPVAYNGAVLNVAELGLTVRALVHVGRLPLTRAVGLQMPPDGDSEKSMWLALADAAQWSNEGDGRAIELDKYRTSQGPSSATTSSPITDA